MSSIKLSLIKAEIEKCTNLGSFFFAFDNVFYVT